MEMIIKENWIVMMQIVKKYPCTLQKVSSNAHFVENTEAKTNGTTRIDKPEIEKHITLNKTSNQINLPNHNEKKYGKWF